jgi:sugar lactone lactonase YvrE
MFIIVIPNIPADARWVQNGVSAAGGHGEGNATNQLSSPNGLFVDDDQTMVIGEWGNNRITQWNMGDTNGQVVAGDHGQGDQLDQLIVPTDVLIDKESNSLIICDLGNQRVVQWSRRSGTTQGKILIGNVNCYGLAMDDQNYLYISDYQQDEVRRYQIGDKNGTLVAGGHGNGADLNQLNGPGYIFVDRQQTVYVSDYRNDRVMKWNKDAKEGTVVAGGQGQGDALTQLSNPQGLSVDTLGTIYVADEGNDRVMRWPKEAKQGTVIAGGNGQGAGANQFNGLEGLSFDRHGNLYVADVRNNRVQLFSIE